MLFLCHGVLCFLRSPGFAVCRVWLIIMSILIFLFFFSGLGFCGFCLGIGFLYLFFFLFCSVFDCVFGG